MEKAECLNIFEDFPTKQLLLRNKYNYKKNTHMTITCIDRHISIISLKPKYSTLSYVKNCDF